MAIFENITLPPTSTIVLALILFGIVLVFILIGILKLRDGKLLVFTNDEGKAEISKKAIQEIIQRTCEQFVEVGRARSELKMKKGQLNLKVSLKLRVKTRLSEITSKLQAQITTAIRDDLGIDNLGTVNVMVEGFLAEAKPKA